MKALGVRTVAVSAGVVALAAVPCLVGGDYGLYVAATACLFAILALAWALPAWFGLFSFGQAAFFGVGAYASALLAGRAGLSPWLGVAAAGVAAAGVAAGLGVACLHLRGPYFSLATLAAAEILRAVATNWEGLTEGAQGLVGIPALPPLALGPLRLDAGSRPGAYGAALVALLVLFVTAGVLQNSAAGAAWAAIRENEERAESLGVPAFRWKMLALLLSAAATGLAGALYAHMLRHLDPATAFNVQFSVMPLVMGFLGGVEHRAGPVAGAVGLYLLNELVLQRWLPTAHLLFYALAIGLVVLYFPRGLHGRVARPSTADRRPSTADR
ncbi:MAG TPA: branched-chain amino acid ABC transporter permease [Candidatus Methylomirabilis sp.]